MRLVEEEYQPGLFGIAQFGQRLEQFGQQPQQKSRVKFGAAHQLVGGENVDDALPARVAAQEIVDLERRFAEKPVRTLTFESEQLALDRPDAGFGNVAVSRGQLARPGRAGDQRLLKIAEIEQQQLVVIGPFEHDREHAFLRVVKIEQARQQ